MIGIFVNVDGGGLSGLAEAIRMGIARGLQEIEPSLLSLKLIRLDYGDSNNTAVLLIDPNENEDIDSIINDLKGKIKDFTCSFFESKNNW